jgi:hypothetical protein
MHRIRVVEKIAGPVCTIPIASTAAQPELWHYDSVRKSLRRSWPRMRDLSQNFQSERRSSPTKLWSIACEGVICIVALVVWGLPLR